MSWITDRMGLKDNQTKARRIDPNKFTLGTVQWGKFYYKSIEQITNTILIATVLSLFIFRSLSFGVSTLIYTTSLLSSLLYTWTADGLYWSLSHQPPPDFFGGGYKIEKVFKDHFLINAAREFATEHSMQ